MSFLSRLFRRQEPKPAVASLAVTSTGTPDADCIFPTIRSDHFIQHLHSQTGSETPIVAVRWLADLWVAYVFDQQPEPRFVTFEDLPGLEMNQVDIHRKAVANLRRLVPHLEWQQNGGIYMAVAGGKYESSFLLVSELWQQIGHEVNGEIIATIPARDLLLYTTTDERSAVRIIRDAARQFHHEAGDAISDVLLKWTEQHWVVHE